MKDMFTSRRMILAIISIAVLLYISINLKVDNSGSIVTLVIGIAGANAIQAIVTKEKK